MSQGITYRGALVGLLVCAVVASGGCGSEPTATPEPPLPPTPEVQERTEPLLTLVAGDLELEPGDCTTLRWSSSGVLQVYLDGRGVEALGELEVCPPEATTYTLKAALPAGGELERSVSIAVAVEEATETPAPTEAPRPTLPPPAAPTAAPSPTATAEPTAEVSVEFYPDGGIFELPADQLCTAVNWRASGVTDVQLEREGMGRSPRGLAGREEVCFGGRVTMFLYYRLPNGTEERREIELRRGN